eukprot:970523-Pelagomonas_calceolata.AAC.7
MATPKCGSLADALKQRLHSEWLTHALWRGSTESGLFTSALGGVAQYPPCPLFVPFGRNRDPLYPCTGSFRSPFSIVFYLFLVKPCKLSQWHLRKRKDVLAFSRILVGAVVTASHAKRQSMEPLEWPKQSLSKLAICF